MFNRLEQAITPGTWKERREKIRRSRLKCLKTPFVWLEWVFERIVCILRCWSFIDLLELVARFSILVAVIFFLAGADERQKQKHYQAWQVLSSSHGKPGSGGRKRALEELNKDQVPLCGVDLSKAWIPGIKLEAADLKDAILERTILLESHLKGANLTNANMKRAKFSRSDLREAVLVDANLERAFFEEADLTRADLSGAKLINTRLSGAIMMYVNLTGAFMEGAQLVEANLRYANLSGAILDRANFDDALLKGTDFQRAYLEKAHGLSATQLCQANSLYNARLNPVLKNEIKKMCPDLLLQRQDTK